MVRKSQRHKQKKRQRELNGQHERFYLNKRKGILIQRDIWIDNRGQVEAYSLVYVDQTLCTKDNGRVLGYDNEHGHHHRHYCDEVEKVEFKSYEDLEARFEAEFREIYEAHHGKDA